MKNKLSDEQLICQCGDLYRDHERPWDDVKKRFTFGCTGRCTKCDCKEYRKRESSNG